MVDFSLTLSINSDDLKIIKAATLRITLAKLVNFEINVGESMAISSFTASLIWLVFEPFPYNNITWNEEYSIYCSSQFELTKGTVISKISQTDYPAIDASYYSFTSNGLFDGPFTDSNSPPSGAYKVNNNMPNTQYPALTFGLQQKASINGSGINPSPLNAAVVPAALNATFTPLTTVYVWLQASYTSGTVITQVNGNATIVTFGGSVTEKSLVYNPATGTFIPSSGGNVTALASFAALASFDDPDVKILKQAGVY